MFKMYRLYCNTQTQSNIKIIGYKFTSFVVSQNQRKPFENVIMHYNKTCSILSPYHVNHKFMKTGMNNLSMNLHYLYHSLLGWHHCFSQIMHIAQSFIRSKYQQVEIYLDGRFFFDNILFFNLVFKKWFI